MNIGIGKLEGRFRHKKRYTAIRTPYNIVERLA
jgi:hypothetical protein